MIKKYIITSILPILVLSVVYLPHRTYHIGPTEASALEKVQAPIEKEKSPVEPNKDVLGVRTITAYNAVPEQTDDTPCITASGHNICENDLNVIATNELPLGTKVEVNGKVYKVLDRTNPRYNYRYDILMETKDEALRWGRRSMEVRVIN